MLRVCLLSAVLETSCDAGDCSLLLYMGFSGDDRDNVAFQTGYQISQGQPVFCVYAVQQHCAAGLPAVSMPKVVFAYNAFPPRILVCSKTCCWHDRCEMGVRKIMYPFWFAH